MVRNINEKNYEKVLLKNKDYYKKNKEKRKIKMKEYYYNHKDKISKYKKTYYEQNKEHAKDLATKYRIEHKEQKKQYMKKYWIKNKDRLKESNALRNKEWWKELSKEKRIQYWQRKNLWEKQKKKKDTAFALKKRLRVRVWQAFNGIRKKSSDELGINYDQIVSLLLNKLPLDYEQDPSKYEIDHIIPLSKFNLNDEKEIKKAFAPENHQWLTSEENARKKDHIEK